MLETSIPIGSVSIVAVLDTTSWYHNTFSENRPDQNASVYQYCLRSRQWAMKKWEPGFALDGCLRGPRLHSDSRFQQRLTGALRHCPSAAPILIVCVSRTGSESCDSPDWDWCCVQTRENRRAWQPSGSWMSTSCHSSKSCGTRGPNQTEFGDAQGSHCERLPQNQGARAASRPRLSSLNHYPNLTKQDRCRAD